MLVPLPLLFLRISGPLLKLEGAGFSGEGLTGA
jgi:hypothetical protein